jgi:DNA-binding response OmpR family regulator
MMPRMKGTEVMLELRQIPGFEIPVIALTADVVSDIGEKYGDVGFHDVITKPIVEEDLYNTLKKYLRENDGTITLDPNRPTMHASDVDKPKTQTDNIGFSDLPDVNYLSEAMSLTSEEIFNESQNIQSTNMDKE